MLEVSSLSIAYGQHRALDGASVRLDRGEICVILGANGAGKSTLLKAIAGMVAQQPGAVIRVDGTDIAGEQPHRIVEHGIALVPEERGIFAELTVAENLRLGAYALRARGGAQAALERVHALFPRLAERSTQPVRTMSGGERQMVAIGRALMSRPDYLLLDEPSLGLAPRLTGELFEALAEIGRSGVAILLVEQNARQSLAIATRGYLLENGRIVSEGPASTLASDPAVVRAYLGGARSRPASRPDIEPPAEARPGDIDAAMLLAERAARIAGDAVREARRNTPTPSAFAGMTYEDTGAAGPASPQATAQAHALTAMANDFANHAAAIERAHRMRLGARTTGQPTSHQVDGNGATSADIGAAGPSHGASSNYMAMAEQAARLHAVHVARLRATKSTPSAFASPPRDNGPQKTASERGPQPDKTDR